MGVPLVGGARLPLAFIGSGLIALTVATGWLAIRPDLLRLPHLHPAVVALAHAWLPGFLLSVCIGAVYQLMPVVLGAPLQLPLAAGWLHLALHVSGVATLVAGFVLGRFELVAAGGSAVTLGIFILALAAWRTFLASARRDVIGGCFPLAASWLAATTLFGVALGANRLGSFLPLSVVDLLRAHAHLGLIGFFLTLLQGATFQLVPMFTMAVLNRRRWVTAGVMLAQLGLIGLTPALAWGNRPLSLGAAVVLAAGVGCSAVALVTTLRVRRRRVLEPGLQAFVAGAALLGVGLLAGVMLAAARGSSEGTVVAYGVVIVAGALGLMVLGMLCKIVPFLVWMRAYGPLAGRRPVPLATSLGSKRLERMWIALHGAALGGVVAGLLAGSAPLCATGTLLLFVAVLVFMANIVRILSHLVRPRTPQAAARPVAFAA